MICVKNVYRKKILIQMIFYKLKIKLMKIYFTIIINVIIVIQNQSGVYPIIFLLGNGEGGGGGLFVYIYYT